MQIQVSLTPHPQLYLAAYVCLWLKPSSNLSQHGELYFYLKQL